MHELKINNNNYNKQIKRRKCVKREKNQHEKETTTTLPQGEVVLLKVRKRTLRKLNGLVTQTHVNA